MIQDCEFREHSSALKGTCDDESSTAIQSSARNNVVWVRISGFEQPRNDNLENKAQVTGGGVQIDRSLPKGPQLIRRKMMIAIQVPRVESLGIRDCCL